MRFYRLLGSAVFLFIPFLGGNHLTLFHLTIDRFWIETSFILLVLLSIVVAIYQKRWPGISFNRFLMFFCPFLVLTVLSLTYTWSRFNTLNEINVLIWAMGVSFLFLVTPDRNHLLGGLVAGAALSALCAVWQFLVLFPSLLEAFRAGGYAAMLKDQHVPFSSFLNQNMLGGYCASILPLALHFAFLRRKKIYMAAACLISVGLVLSLSRLAVLACIPSCAVIGVLVFRERGVKGILQMAVCLGSAVLLVFLMIYGPYNRTNSSIQSTLKGKIQRSYREASTLNFRTDIWGTGLKAFRESPLLGYGAGSFVYPYQKHYEGKRYTKVAHGTLVKVLVELGAAGLLCFLWFCFGALRNLKDCRQDQGMVAAGLSALAVFLFGLFDFSFDTPAHVITFFCLASACFLTRSSADAPSPNLTAKLISPLLILPLLASFVYTSRADSSRRFVEDARAHRETGCTEGAQRSLAEAVGAMPWNNDASTFLISLLTSSFVAERDPLRKEGFRTDLIGYVRGAEKRSDKDAEVYFVIGIAKEALGEGVRSCEYMDRALHYHPSSGCYAFSASACYGRHGRIEQAQSIIRSMEVYYDNYRTWGYPDGLMVHRLKDLEAEIEFAKGNKEQALSLMRQNLESANNDQFVINDWRARQSLSKGALVDHLEQRIRVLEAKIGQDRHNATATITH
ncbi:MAG TPA: hypothetical protein DCR97_11355 [Deltaproteobacteria bacterium]|nr:hypothetical protein [Deltaproteobacteria bacterium]